MDYEDTACTCHYRHVSPDGCKDWSCPYHGEENRNESLKQRAACPVHRYADIGGEG